MSLTVRFIPPNTDFAKTWDEAAERCIKAVTEGLSEAEVTDVRIWFAGHIAEGDDFYKRITRGTHDAIMTLCSMGFG